MLTLYKILLAPALLYQGGQLRRTALRLPEARGPRSGLIEIPGTPALRLLFIGDSSAAGVGVDWQHEALAEQAADAVSAASKRSVRWQLVARSGVNTREAIELVIAHDLQPADVVITALGVNDVTSQRDANEFVRDYRQLLAMVVQRSGARGFVLCGLPPMHRLPAAPQPLRWYLGQCSNRLDAALRDYCDEHENRRFISFDWASPGDMAHDNFHPGKKLYGEWAQRVAEKILALNSQVGLFKDD